MDADRTKKIISEIISSFLSNGQKKNLKEDVLAPVEHLYREIIVRFSEKLQKHGIVVGNLKKIGSGGNGIAYDMGDGKVFKVTVDPREAKASNLILGKSLKHIVKIYDVFKFPDKFEKGKAIYGIVQEKLDSISSSDKARFDETMSLIESSMPVFTNDDFSRGVKNVKSLFERNKITKEEFERFKKSLEYFNVPQMYAELVSLDINFGDWHSGNILKRGSDFVLIDLGQSKSPGSEPNVLEKVTKNILDEIAADTIAVVVGKFQPFHKGYSEIVRKLAKNNTKVIIAIDSLKNTKENPLSYDSRVELIEISIPELQNKLEVYKADSKGFVPSTVLDIINNHSSTLKKNSAFTVYAGSDRVEQVKKQLEYARENLEDFNDVFTVEKLDFTDDQAGSISNSAVIDLFVNNKKEELLKLLDPHVSSDESRFDQLYDKIRKELKKHFVILEFLTDVAKTKDDGAKLLDFIIDKECKKLLKRGIETRTMKKLGTGNNGTAFVLNNKKVFKITTDDAEARAANAIKDKELQFVYKIYDVFKFPKTYNGHYIYGIVQEENLEKPSETERSDFDWLMNKIESVAKGDEIASGKLEAILERMMNDKKIDKKTKKKVLDLLKSFNVASIMSDLSSVGISFSDFHSGNIMKRGSDYVVIDLGTAGTGTKDKKKEPSKLEEDLSEFGADNIDQVLQMNAEALMRKKKIDVNAITVLGNGKMGVAYDVGSEKILKVTTDPDEARASYLLQQKGSSLKHVVKIYDTFEFKVKPKDAASDVYGIIQEKLTVPSDAEKKKFDDIISEFTANDSVLDKTAVGDIDGAWQEYRKFVESDIRLDLSYPVGSQPNPKKEEKLKSVFAQRVGQMKKDLDSFSFFDMVKELHSVGIQFGDYHGDNIAKRGSDWVVIDIGRSKGGTALPPMFEQIVQDIMDEMTVSAGPMQFDRPDIKAQSSRWSNGYILEPSDERPENNREYLKSIAGNKQFDPQMFERKVALDIRKQGHKALVIGNNSKFPDIMVESADGKKAFVEVKLDWNSQLGSPRFNFDGNRWSSSSESAIAKKLIKELNESKEAADFIESLKKFLGRKTVKLISTKDHDKLKTDESIVTREEMKLFLENISDQNILKIENVDLTNIVAEHYTEGKTRPADYIQIGNSFYRFGKNNPLKVRDDVPMFKAFGKTVVRVGMRSSCYEIQAEIKSSAENHDSAYSATVDLDKQKLFPF